VDLQLSGLCHTYTLYMDDSGAHIRKHFSDDGAWISRKCAKTLGGDFSLKIRINEQCAPEGDEKKPMPAN